MTFEVWLAFAVASVILLVIPGPTVMLVVSYALAEGRRSAWGTVPGVGLGDLTAMTLSLIGLGAVLSASAALFTVLKWIGACYLIYLGVRMWRRTKLMLYNPEVESCSRSTLAMLGHAFVVTAFNPKSIAFFVAFVPQFVTPEMPILPQMILLIGTFVFLAIVNATAYALLAGTVRDTVDHPGVLQGINRLGGCILVSAGIMMAVLRKTS